MDVVYSNLSKIGGVIDIDSTLGRGTQGRGTQVRLKLPLTLAILPSLLIEAEGERCALRQVNLVQLRRIRAQERAPVNVVAVGASTGALGIIMSGMGADGAIAQDESSCVVFGMPVAAVELGVVDVVVPLGELSDAIAKAVAEDLAVPPKIQPSEMSMLTDFVKQLTGIVLEPQKAYLAESRLGPLVEKGGFIDYGDMLRKARRAGEQPLRSAIVDAITTNETSFFRDMHPFLLLMHKLIPDRLEQQIKKGVSIPTLKIWCAACSTGQEVYSVAIVLKELLGNLDKCRVCIVGTDISEAVLVHASRGIYSRLEVARGLSDSRLRRFFSPEGDKFKIHDELRFIVTFKRANLLKPISDFALKHLDIVLCRNVAIYFSVADRKVLYSGLADHLEDWGTLIIGATESLRGITDRFARQEFRGHVYFKKANGR